MSTSLAATRDTLVESLRAVERHTERLFLALGESLPALVVEMRSSVELSKGALGCLDGENQAETCGQEAAIRRVSDELSADVMGSARTIEEVAARDEELFTQLQDGINQLSAIEDAIMRIRSDSEEMELVSLNAMTVALKAGNTGRAFSYITDELRRLAGRTISITREVTGRGTALLDRFRALEVLLGESRSFQSELLSHFQTRLRSALDEFQGTMGALVSGLRDLQARSTGLEGPVTRLMEAVQLQDLIRQSIDHIILSLNSFDPAHAEQSDDAALDELAYMRRVPELARSLVSDVAAQIRASADTFRRTTRDAGDRLTALDAERDAITAGRITRGEHTVDLEGTLRVASDELTRLIEDLGTNMRRKDQLVARSVEITNEVSALDEHLRRFYPLVQRFHSIDVASRIEVAKQATLRAMGTRTDQMTELTTNIEKDVESAVAATQRFIGSTSSTIGRHGESYREEVAFFEGFRDRIQRYRDRLGQARAATVEVVGEFSLFTDGFYSVFRKTVESGSELDTLATSLESVVAGLDAMERDIETRFQAALRARGAESWEIGNDRLLGIIDRFTIFAHKQRAVELTGTAVESAVTAGEVTLF